MNGSNKQVPLYLRRRTNNGFISSSVYKVMGVEPIMTQCMLEEYRWTKGNVLIVLCRTALPWTPTGSAGSQGKRTTSTLLDKQDTHELHGDPLKAMSSVLPLLLFLVSDFV